MLNRGFDEPIMERPGEWAYEPVDQRYSLHTSSRPPNRHEMSVKLSHEHELYDDRSCYYLPLLTVNLLRTYEICDDSLKLGDSNSSRQLNNDNGQDIRYLDDSDGFLNMKKGTVIKGNSGSLYRVFCNLGKGTFGQAFVCRGLETGDYFAVKIIRSKPEYVNQGENELRMLSWINEVDAKDDFHLIRLSDYLFINNHHFYLSPLYSFTLFQLLQRNAQGLPFSLIHHIAVSLLQSLSFLHRNGIIHTDLKPENILFEGTGPSLEEYTVRLIDMGSCVLEKHFPSHYCQSCYYRAPEVFLRKRYGTGIDIWSLGIVLCECYISSTLLCGDTDHEMLFLISKVIGEFPYNMVANSHVNNLFFNIDNRGSFQVKPLQKFRDYRSIPPSYKDTIQYKQMKLGSSLEEQNVIKKERSQFIDFLSYMLVIEPQDRHSAEMLLQHPFITKNDSQYCPIVSGNYEGHPPPLTPIEPYSEPSLIRRAPMFNHAMRPQPRPSFRNQGTAYSVRSTMSRVSQGTGLYASQPTSFSTQDQRTPIPTYYSAHGYSTYSSNGRRDRRPVYNPSQVDMYMQSQWNNQR